MVAVLDHGQEETPRLPLPQMAPAWPFVLLCRICHQLALLRDRVVWPVAMICQMVTKAYYWCASFVHGLC